MIGKKYLKKDIRCKCGKVLMKVEEKGKISGVEIKCRVCKNINIINHNA